ncbi:MAG TPA: T9SS type A sorting domain-containing protein [candidate division WOR-3 bacterium]|uniref:T9SS type A sorting domain-containing protein n=1 Tax=candidate division WOR-3 bacterium TaxID=2052148 RepID=A0A9C9ENG8_UNCW3|nr:T9SS type A sorting domain-containing protein [candidate division WOR-3 bacterium]
MDFNGNKTTIVKIGTTIKILPIFFVILFLSLFSTTEAATYTVGTVSEFQNALNNAAGNNENDTIIVLDGTYNVSSTITYSSTENFSLCINGQGTPLFEGGDSIQLFNFLTTAGNADLYLNGCTIEHGRSDYGGGAHLETVDANISVQDCNINDNEGNIICGGLNLYSVTGSITVENCTFRRNSSPNTSGYPFGTAGGLFIQTEQGNNELRVTGCIFEDNFAQRDAAGAMLYPLGTNSQITVDSCIFQNNTSNEFCGGCWMRAPAGDVTIHYTNNLSSGNVAAVAGGGASLYIEIASGTVEISDNIHTNNTSAWEGGALWISHGGGIIDIYNETYTNNLSGGNGGAGNIYLESGILNLHHNIFNENESSASGGGVCISTASGTLNIFNNTFYSNTGTDGGDLYLYFDTPSSSADFYNNILYQSSLPALSFSGQQTMVATYSDIDGGTGQPWFGTGCIEADPLFADPAGGDFHLTWVNFPIPDSTKSPCIDTGDPASPPDPDGTTADMGALYFNQSSGIEERSQHNQEEGFRLYKDRSHSSSSSITIRYSLPKSSWITIDVYNINGQLVKTLVNGYRTAGDYKVVWDAKEFSNGTYFCRLKNNDCRLTRKLILVK